MIPAFQARFDALAAARSPLCVGVDPSTDALTQWGLTLDAAGLRRFCDTLVDACAPLVAAIKPQVAFFERFGPIGMAVLRDTVERARSHGALVIIDTKVGDISSTAAAYGEAFLGPGSPFGGDAITASAFLGFGSLAPIVAVARREQAMVFVVVRSSNPEGAELQHAVMRDGRTVAERLADDITAENGGDNGPLGAVVGATLGSEARTVAARMPDALMLVPGIGAQGATIADVRGDFGAHYRRVIPSLSRGIAGAGPDPGALRDTVLRHNAVIRGD
ncbi:MAG TPA: orotidine-5'-phosphate decarboxylase [Stellaceae bacterium]|nr:orotidine-5'-phosphate decarboxylase [Stellaceae bacterium]